MTPYEAFTGQVSPWSINDFRVFGSPTYVLRKELQDGVTLNKWKPRSWLGVYIGTSNCHASAIPLIYNPTSTHVSPQFHVIYDEYFYTVNPSNSAISDVYLSKLYNSSAKWLYRDPYSDDPHFFGSFWDDTASSPIPRKRPCPTTNTELSSRGSAAKPDSHRIPPGCLRGSVHTLNSIQTTSCPPGYPPQHPAPPEPSTQEPLAAPAQPTLPMDALPHVEANLGALNTSVQSTHLAPPLRANPDPHASTSRPPSVPTSMRPQYEYKDRTDAYQAYKILRGINGGILVLISQASAVFPQAENQLSTEEDPLSLPNIFSAFTNLPFETPNTPIYAFPVMDNKADTLTQSQMLKATDAQHFISAQPKEIKGLVDMGVVIASSSPIKIKSLMLLFVTCLRLSF